MFARAAGSGSSGFPGEKGYFTPESPGDIKMSHNSPNLSRFFHKERGKRDEGIGASEQGKGMRDQGASPKFRPPLVDLEAEWEN